MDLMLGYLFLYYKISFVLPLQKGLEGEGDRNRDIEERYGPNCDWLNKVFIIH